MSTKLVRWAIFGVAFALMPVFAIFLNAYLVPRPQTPDLSEMLGNGELVLISCLLCTGSVGELIGLSPRAEGPPQSIDLELRKLVCGGMALLIAVASAILYSSIRVAPSVNMGVSLQLSLAFFLCGLIASGSCIYLSEK
jgi:hypothetical protein